MRSNLANLAILILIGLVLLLIGLFLLWYPSYMVGSLQESLGQSELGNPERDALQGSLNWWLAWGKITYEPIAIVAFASGIIVLVSTVVYYVVSTRRKARAIGN